MNPRWAEQRFRDLTASEKVRLLEGVDWAQQHSETTLPPRLFSEA
jgi:hypothetical protein